MDSLTHLVLGAAIGQICLGKKEGNKAMLIGAFANTIPDFDVFLAPLFNDVAYLEVHRSYSHAWFVQFFLAIPFVYLFKWMFRQRLSFGELYKIIILCLLSHSLLDCCTTYGTMLLLPFSKMLVSFNNLNIIDPLYTLPFLCIVVSIFFIKKINPLRTRLAKIGLYLSTFYLLLTGISKYQAHKHFTNELNRQQLPYNELSTVPSFLNNVLWSGIAVNDSLLTIGEYSHLQTDKTIAFASFARQQELLLQANNKKEIDILKWFSQNKYFVHQPSADTLEFYNTKRGRADWNKTALHQQFIFYTLLYKDSNAKWQTDQIEPRDSFKVKDAIGQLWNRIFEK